MADTVGQNAHGYDHDNLRHVVITSTCFAFILSTTAVGFRIISRAINGNGLFLDDWFILLALVSDQCIAGNSAEVNIGVRSLNMAYQ